MRRLMTVLALMAAIAVPLRADALSVATTWSVGHQPFGVVVDPTDGRVYAANNGGPTVSVVDPARNTVGSIAVGMQPGLMALDAASRRLYVSNSGDMTLSVIDLATQRVVMTVYDAGGLGVALNPALNRAYVAGGTSLAGVNTVTGIVSDFVSTSAGESWFGVVSDPSLHRLYVTNIAAPPSLRVLDDRDYSFLGTVALPKPVRFAMAVDPSSHAVYLASEAPSGNDAELYVVDANSLTITHTTALGGGFSSGLALKPTVGRLYVTDQSHNALRAIDTSTFAVAATLSLPWGPALLDVGPDGRAYIAGWTADVLGAVDLNEAPVDQAPAIDSITLTPATARTNDVVTAAVATHDPDGDPVTLSYQWAVNNVPVAAETAASIDLSKPGNGNRDDTLCVTVTASDGRLSTSLGSCLVIQDTAPVGTVALDNAAPTTSAVLTATATASDADGDPLTYTFTWKVNGAVRKTASGLGASDTFDLSVAGNGDRGDGVVVELVVADDRLSSAVSSASATVANTAPTVSLSLSDSSPRKKDTLVATAVGTDADADALTYSWTWSVNGVTKRTTTSLSATDSFSLRAVGAANGDVVTVSVTASDGAATSDPATASARVTQGNGGGGPDVAVTEPR